MNEFLTDMNKWADELEARAKDIRAAATNHANENNDESRSTLRLAIAMVKPVLKVMRYTLKTPNVEVTGAARLYRAASGGPQGYATI